MPVDALDDALTVLAATAPSYGPLGLANHGPMAAEALHQLGRDEAMTVWVEHYRARLDEAPPPGHPLTADQWEDALGQDRRYPDWLALFQRRLSEEPARAVVASWVPRLLPGTIGAATHGLIRTGHALRSLGEADTVPRRLETAAALALWASSYQELPGPPLLIGHQGVAEALADLPYLPEGSPTQVLISDMVAQVHTIAEEFEQGVASLGGVGEPLDMLDQVAAGGALAYLRNADGGGAIGLLHSITAPLACELVLPWLDPDDRDAALGYAWQAAASLHVAYALDRHGPVPARSASSTRALIDMAIASGDEHAIKLTEAAVRCYARGGDPLLMWAAADACVRL